MPKKLKYDRNKQSDIVQSQHAYNPIDIYVEQIDRLTSSEDLIEKNLRFALKEAHKYKNNGMDLEDLIQEANKGLVVAAEKYDASKGPFLHYAKFYIRKFILATLTTTNGSVSEASGHKYAVRMIKRTRQNLVEAGNLNPSISDIAAACGKSERQVKFALSGQVQGIVRLDMPVDHHSGDCNRDTHEVISLDNLDANADGYGYSSSPEMTAMAADRRAILTKMFSELPDQERDAVIKRLIEGKTLQEIAEEHGMTTTGVKGIVERAVCMLMDAAEKYKQEMIA